MQTIAPARPGHPRALLAVLLVAPFLASVDATIANVATPAIRTSLGASGAETELVVGGYLVAYAMLLITGARLGQTHGYKRLFLTGVALFATTSVACGLAPNAGALIAARVLQGGSAAMMFPQTMTGIQLHFNGRARTRAIGLYAIALSAGAVIGQIAGGVLISADIAGTGWRAIFLVNVPVCVALLACGGLGLGTQFATLMGHIMGAVPACFAPDISGVTSTTTQVGGALGVAGFGSLYLALAATPGSAHASHAFGLTSLALAVTAALAAVGAYLATHVSDHGGQPDRAAKPRHSGDLVTTASGRAR